MLSWVDLFGAKLKSFKTIEAKLLTTRIIADNAKHAKLFSDRARELGENPEKYNPPKIGQRIYDILESYSDPIDEFAYAWGSLIHFSALLEIYRSVGDPRSQAIVDQVRKDVREHLTILEKYFEKRLLTSDEQERVNQIKMIANDIYADREDEEIKWYAA